IVLSLVGAAHADDASRDSGDARDVHSKSPDLTRIDIRQPAQLGDRTTPAAAPLVSVLLGTPGVAGLGATRVDIDMIGIRWRPTHTVIFDAAFERIGDIDHAFAELRLEF